MNAILVLVVLSSTAVTAAAQSPSTSAAPAPGVKVEQVAGQPATVLKHSWAKLRIGWEADPFAGPVESFEDVRRRAVDTRRLERARNSGNTAEASKVEREMRAEQVLKARPPKPPRYAFVYKIEIKNNSDKAITEFDWDYIFFDAVTQAEVGRRQFTGVEKINPGKSKELSFTVSSPPAKSISVYALEKGERRGLTEAVVLVRVVYADGTEWRNPGVSLASAQ